MKIRIGTRGSKLARWQAEWVAARLAEQAIETEIVILKTLGDVKSGPIGNVGTQGVFTNEIQRAVLDGQADLAVHSLKDLPTDQTDGLMLAAVPPRENCGDALVSKQGASLADLPQGAAVATGSARRRAQLLAARPDLDVRELRGNIDTRLQKLQDDAELAAIILAEAGLRRLGLQEHITEVISKQVMLPAVGQGALGLECRADDTNVTQALQQLDDQPTRAAVTAERALLRALRGGCLAPVGAWAREQQGQLRLDAIVLNSNGSQQVTASDAADWDAAEALGVSVAQQLQDQGAEQLLQEARG